MQKEKVKVYIDEKYHHATDSIRPPHKQKTMTTNATENNTQQFSVEFSSVANPDHQSPQSQAQQASAVTNATSQISTPKTANKTNNPNKATRKQSFGGNPAKSAANSRSSTLTRVNANTDETYGKDIKNIPKATWKLLTNKIYIVTCLVSVGSILAQAVQIF